MFRQLIGQTRSFKSSASKWVDQNIENKVQKLEQLKSGPLEDHGKFPGMPLHKPSKWDRLFLVWSGHYKTMADVPNRIEHATIHKSRNWARIKLNIIMVGVGLGICGFMVYLGKRDARMGRSVEAENLAWHRKINEEYRREQAAKAAADGERPLPLILSHPKSS